MEATELGKDLLKLFLRDILRDVAHVQGKHLYFSLS